MHRIEYIMKIRGSISSSLIITFCCIFVSGVSLAKTRYVTDTFDVMMRTGPSVKNKIVRVLKSGDALDVLKSDAGNGYSQVKSKKGDVGYVLIRYLDDEESAKNRVVYLEDLLAKLKSKPQEIQAILAKSQEQNEVLIGENKDIKLQLMLASSELKRIKEISKDSIAISNKSIRLEGEAQKLLLQLDDLRIQNQALKDNANYVRNLTMVGILLLGLFLGWILSRSGKQRRNSWGA